MHPVYLARLFRRSFGTSMGQYLRRRRIRVVIGRLGGGGSLSTVAHETGFADHPHMCRAFRAETGMTPSAYELLLASREVSSVQDPEGAGVQIVAGTGSEVTCAPVSPGRYRPCC